MFIHLLYGKGELLLVNINCHIIHLERFIKDSCHHDRSEIIDLCNETGDLIGIPRRDPWEMAIGWFEPRKIYIPLTVHLGSVYMTLCLDSLTRHCGGHCTSSLDKSDRKCVTHCITYVPWMVYFECTDKFTLKSYIPWLENFEKLYPEATESLDVQISSRHKDKKWRSSKHFLPAKADEKTKKTPKKPNKKDAKVKKNSKSGLFE